MTTNPYANPTMHVTASPAAEQAPALWNPNAAANWSLLFSPAFGAFLHMKNWQALGEPEKAAAAKRWVWIALLFAMGGGVLAVMLPDTKGADAISRALAVGMLVTWYLTNGRAHATYVKERFGTAYPRKGWGKPLALALLATAGFFAVVFFMAFAAYA